MNKCHFSFAGFLIALVLWSCDGSGAHTTTKPSFSSDPRAENYDAPPLPKAAVLLRGALGEKYRVEVELAATDNARERGLMWRKSLESGKGMLFLFPEEKV